MKNLDIGFLHRMTEELQRVNPTGAAWEMRRILSFCSDKGMMNLFLNEEKLSEDEQAAVQTAVARRVAGEPLAYVTGEAEFLGMPFFVNRETLIPRPETEILVEAASRWLIERFPGDPELRALDLGTGCGNIAVGLLKAVPMLRVDAVEVSSRALEVASKNFSFHGVAHRTTLYEKNYVEEKLGFLSAKYHVIAANPPYVGMDDYRGLPEEVRREPALALIGGPKGDEMIQWIIRNARAHLLGGGALFLEIGFGQAPGVLAYAGNFRDIKTAGVIEDEQGISRIVVLEKV